MSNMRSTLMPPKIVNSCYNCSVKSVERIPKRVEGFKLYQSGIWTGPHIRPY